jgi:electron-transferring-flavoprotein dehydrogenase
MYSGVDTLLVKGRVPWTFKHHGSDAAHTGKAQDFKPIDYPHLRQPLSTDLMTSVSLTGTNHAEDQPVHLLVRKPEETTEDDCEEDGACEKERGGVCRTSGTSLSRRSLRIC